MMRCYYISFASDTGFRGGAYVMADSHRDAVVEATRHGANPGGEALTVPLPDEADTPPAQWMNRLLSLDELRAMDEGIHGPGQQPVRLADLRLTCRGAFSRLPSVPTTRIPE